MAERNLTLRHEEAHHAVRSLRLHAGDELLATDLAGNCYRCRVLHSVSEAVQCKIEEVLLELGESKRDILLSAAMLSQPSRWEFLLEKATELGVREILPLQTERTERMQFRKERSDKILRAAVKQTRRARIPLLADPLPLREALAKASADHRSIILLHEAASEENSFASALQRAASGPITIVIGPEGGFTDTEVELAQDAFGASVVSLGPRRLRAETAALAALAIAMSI